jgi:2-keto-4-pentenoate hydratase/2-oxohepta-3-ene-1,7-dioic acid hydratase in catechol pathway
MRIVSYSRGGRPGAGVVVAERMLPLHGGDDEPLTLRRVLEEEDGPDHQDALLARAQASADRHEGSLSLDDIAFRPVVEDPRALWCAALTFKSHVTEAPGRTPPRYPLFFLRVADSHVAHGQALVVPAVSDRLDYEGELAVIIGRTARHVPVADALAYVAGYSCYNEGSVRDWQQHTPQITPGKNFSSSGSFGPWLVTPDEFGDPYSRTITTRVNGEVRQEEPLSSLLFRIEYLIHYLSTIHTLRPGDVVVCGTPGGVGMRRDPPVFLAPGDVVTVEIDGIGTLENPVVSETPAVAPTWRPNNVEESVR